MRHYPTAAAILLCLGMAACSAPAAPPDPRPVLYDASGCPNLWCLDERVLVWTRPGLSQAAAGRLWSAHGLKPGFEWRPAGAGWAYYELEQSRPGLGSALQSLLDGRLPRQRTVRETVEALSDHPAVVLAAPDALLFEWASDDPPAVDQAAPGRQAGKGVCFVDPGMRPLPDGLAGWLALPADQRSQSVPLPDFEYYRECLPEGTRVGWHPLLAGDAEFTADCGVAYGVGQAAALAQYEAAGAPALSPTVVCVADTGVLLSHPDLAGRLTGQAVDCNYRNYVVAEWADRPGRDERLAQRDDARLAGYPRTAIKGRPAYHGTCVAGILARCTGGFKDAGGQDAVRLLPVSLKSERVYAVTGWKVKSPISAFMKLIACLDQEFPTNGGPPAAGDGGNVRVVSLSAGIPRTMFSGREWRIVEPIVSKAEEAVRADLRRNDRVYVFAAGNERQSAPNRPGTLAEVLSVSASMPYDRRAWQSAPFAEGSNLGDKCVSAPGYGIISSTLYPCPNLAYLPETEIPQARPNFSTPPRPEPWTRQTNRFSATSAATPQVSALAALLFAQRPGLTYREAIAAIEASTDPENAARWITAEWGKARGLVDYRAALPW